MEHSYSEQLLGLWKRAHGMWKRTHTGSECWTEDLGGGWSNKPLLLLVMEQRFDYVDVFLNIKLFAALIGRKRSIMSNVCGGDEFTDFIALADFFANPSSNTT